MAKKGQSILEYAILVAIVIAAVVVMQVYMKRGVAGRIKESSDRLSGGESFSASNTTTYQHNGMVDGARKARQITEITSIDSNAANIAQTIMPEAGAVDISGHDAYSASTSTGGDSNSVSKMATDDASHEAFKAGDLKSTDASGAAF